MRGCPARGHGQRQDTVQGGEAELGRSRAAPRTLGTVCAGNGRWAGEGRLRRGQQPAGEEPLPSPDTHPRDLSQTQPWGCKRGAGLGHSGSRRAPPGSTAQGLAAPRQGRGPGAPPAGCQRRAAPGQLAPCPAEPPGRGWGEGGGPRAAGPEAPGPSSPPRNTPGHAASTAPTVTSPASRQVPRARQPRPYRGDAAAPGAHWPVACRWRERATGRGHAAAGSGVRWGRRGRE